MLRCSNFKPETKPAIVRHMPPCLQPLLATHSVALRRLPLRRLCLRAPPCRLVRLSGMISSIRDRYAALLADGAISPDPAQAAAVARLGALERAACRITGAPRNRRRSAGCSAAARSRAPLKGLYIYGEVGPRQDHADGSVLRRPAASRASAACISTSSWPTCTSASTISGRR